MVTSPSLLTRSALDSSPKRLVAVEQLVSSTRDELLFWPRREAPQIPVRLVRATVAVVTLWWTCCLWMMKHHSSTRVTVERIAIVFARVSLDHHHAKPTAAKRAPVAVSRRWNCSREQRATAS